MNNNENNQKKDDFNDDFNNDNTFKEGDNNDNNENNNDTFRISDINNNTQNRYSNNNFKNDDNQIQNGNQNNENENNFEYEDNNNNFENQNNNNFENEDNNNNFNNDNGGENNIEDNNQNNRDMNSFGFRDSDLKDNNNINPYEDNNNINPYEDNNNNNVRNSGNSDNIQFGKNNNNIRNSDNSDNDPFGKNNNINKDNSNEENNNLRNKPNNTNKNNINNSINSNKNSNLNKSNNTFNYAKNPYESNLNNNNNYNNYNNNYNDNYNNYNQNGGGFGTPLVNANQTTTNFISQNNNNNIMNNLNYNYSSNYEENSTKKHHPDYVPYWEDFEEYPEDSDGFPIDPNKKGKDSSASAGIQIANTIMGAGILSIPIIMSYLGILLGLVIVLFLAVSTIYSVFILIRCHEITGKSGYSMFGKMTMGKFGSILIKIIIIINNFGICVCYFRIFGEVIQTIVQNWASPDSIWVTNWHNFIYILLGSIILYVFIFIKNISALKKVAYLGVISVLIFTLSFAVLLFYRSSTNKLANQIDWDYLFPNCTFDEAFHAVPTVFLAFLFQFNVFPIYYSMRHRNMDSMMKATKIGVGYSFIIFLFVGIIGFLLYGFDIDDTVLDNLSDDMIEYRNKNTFIIVLIIIICISFVITCLTSFPILFLSLRVNYINSLVVCIKSCKKNDEGVVRISQGKYANQEKILGNKTLIFITVMLYVFIVLIAIVVYKLKTMFTMVGASAGTFIAFILPNLFYIIIVKRSGKDYSVVVPFIFFGMGIFLFIIAIMIAIF